MTQDHRVLDFCATASRLSLEEGERGFWSLARRKAAFKSAGGEQLTSDERFSDDTDETPEREMYRGFVAVMGERISVELSE